MKRNDVYRNCSFYRQAQEVQKKRPPNQAQPLSRRSCGGVGVSLGIEPCLPDCLAAMSDDNITAPQPFHVLHRQEISCTLEKQGQILQQRIQLCSRQSDFAASTMTSAQSTILFSSFC